MHRAISKIIACEQYLYDDSSLLRENHERLVLRFLERIWRREDLGPWSNTTLDGPTSLVSIVENEITLRVTALFAYFLAKGLGTIPIMLELENKNDKIYYKLKFDGDGGNWRGMSLSRCRDYIYLLGEGEQHEEWTWAYEVTGALDMPK